MVMNTTNYVLSDPFAYRFLRDIYELNNKILLFYII